MRFQAPRWQPGGQRVLDLMKHYAMSNDDNYENQGSKTLQFCQAIDNGDHYTDLLMTVNPNHLYKGQLLLILRSTQQTGPVTVRATSPTLKAATWKAPSL
ncbi:MAG: hypothetical protein K5899_07520 [Bacteroidaceae bacterium]|nr:hypothetical protein [Bacteroidaceae bacterium]